MQYLSKVIGGALGLAFVVAGAAEAAPIGQNYAVRPLIQVGGGGTIDGYEVGGATQRSENFTSDYQSHVNLVDGTVKTYLKVNGPGGFGSVFGGFADRVTFSNSASTTINFSFDFDGQIKMPARDPALNQFMQVFLVANLYVFDTSAGATLMNFTNPSLDAPLVKQTFTLNITNPTADVNQLVNETLAGSLVAGPNAEYDIIATLSMGAAPNGNPATLEADFLNTATFGIGTEPGVTFTSDSGALLGSSRTPGPNVAVPEPATLGLLGLGLLGLGIARRRAA